MTTNLPETPEASAPDDFTPAQPITLPPPLPLEEPPAEAVIVVRRSTVYYIATALLFFVAGYMVSWAVFASSTGSLLTDVKAAAASGASEAVGTGVAKINVNQAVALAPTMTPTAVPIQQIEIGDSPSWGPVNAKVTVVEFSDFECPYCGTFYRDGSYNQLRKRYGDKIHYVFKDFPLNGHPNAFPAALAARCANEQGKFWEYHDTLFENQSSLSSAALKSYAEKVNVPDLAKFNTCYDSQQYKPQVDASVKYAISKYAEGTPTFYINGQIVRGAPRDFEALAGYLDYLLAQS